MAGNFATALREALVRNLTAAIDQALAEVGFSVAGTVPPARTTASVSPAPKRRGRPAGSTNKNRTAARKEVTGYNPTDPNARRLPGFMRALLGREIPKVALAQRYGNFTFTPKTTKEEAESQAKKIDASRSAAAAAAGEAADTGKKATAPAQAARTVKAKSPARRKKAATTTTA